MFNLELHGCLTGRKNVWWHRVIKVTTQEYALIVFPEGKYQATIGLSHMIYLNVT